MHQLLLLLAAVSSVSASADPKKKVVKAMEGCKLVWEEEENCVTESNVEICRMKDTQHCEEVKRYIFQHAWNCWLLITMIDFNFLGVKNRLPSNCCTGQVQVLMTICSGIVLVPFIVEYIVIESGQAKEGSTGGKA